MMENHLTGSGSAARQRYKVLKKIDAGGMAEIFIARAQAVGGIEKTVAIKRVLPSLTRNRRFVNMFLDEARLSMVLTHANIVQVFDVGRADDTYYIVMEYVDGSNMRRLFQRMSEKGYRMPIELAAFLMMEVCKGLAHAHEQRGSDGKPLGIVHRDISPPNILISKAGEVKITDFGLAKAVTQLEVTDPGIVKGKFSYLSPEAANGKTVDHRADVFAVGILLWEILANRRLFLGKSDMETVELIRKAEVPSLSLFNKDVSEEFSGIVEKALARDVKARFHSARDFGDALAGYLFANNLKVTSYDLANLLKQLSDEDGQPGAYPEQRIGVLLDEEVLSMSMMGVIGEGQNASGARPLNDVEVAGSTSGGRLSVAEIWQPPNQVELTGHEDLANGLAEHDSDRMAGALEAPASKVEEAAGGTPQSGSSVATYAIAAVVAIAVAAGVYFLLSDGSVIETIKGWF